MHQLRNPFRHAEHGVSPKFRGSAMVRINDHSDPATHTKAGASGPEVTDQTLRGPLKHYRNSACREYLQKTPPPISAYSLLHTALGWGQISECTRCAECEAGQ